MDSDRAVDAETGRPARFPATYLAAFATLSLVNFAVGVVGMVFASQDRRSQLTALLGSEAMSKYVAFCNVGIPFSLMLGSILIGHWLWRKNLDYRFALFAVQLAVIGSLIPPSAPLAVYCWILTTRQRSIFVDRRCREKSTSDK